MSLTLGQMENDKTCHRAVGRFFSVSKINQLGSLGNGKPKPQPRKEAGVRPWFFRTL